MLKKNWVGSDTVLIFEDMEDAEKEAKEYWRDSLEGDSGLVNMEEAGRNGFLNKSHKEVEDDWVEGEVETYQKDPDDAISDFQSLSDKNDEWTEEIESIEEELDNINDGWDEIKYLMKGMRKPKEKPSRKSISHGEKITVLLMSDDAGKRQAVELLEALADIDENDPQEVADLYGMLDKAYDTMKDAYDEKDDELTDKKDDYKDWYQNDLIDLIADEVEDQVRSDIQMNYHGDMFSYLTMHYGLDEENVIENYYNGIDYEAYAEHIVDHGGAGTLNSYDGNIYEECGLVWLLF
jgi:chromosome segregation ATPase